MRIPSYNQLLVAEIVMTCLLIPLAVFNARTGRWFWFVINMVNIMFLVNLMFQNRMLAWKFGAKS